MFWQEWYRHVLINECSQISKDLSRRVDRRRWTAQRRISGGENREMREEQEEEEDSS